MKISTMLAAFVVGLGFIPSGFSEESLEGKLIKKITITDNRTDSREILPRISLKEGAKWHQSDVDSSRQKLFDMRVFKEIDIKSEYDKDSDGVNVTIKAKDGWFLLPLPFVSGGGGGTQVSMVLVEGNMLKKNESMFLYGNNEPGKNAVGLGFDIDDNFFSATYVYEKKYEHQYADGWRNAGNFFVKDKTDNGDYGPVSALYSRRVEAGSFLYAHSFDRFNLSVGYTLAKMDYNEDITGPVPGDGGNHSGAIIGASYNTDSKNRRMDNGRSFGVLFGLGLADLEERLKYKPGTDWNWNAYTKLGKMDRFFGSDYSAARMDVGALLKAELPERHLFRLSALVSKGFSLPDSDRVTSNDGLSGLYSREFQGSTTLSARAAFAYYLTKSKRGIWVGEPFVESGTAFSSGTSGTQTGAGVNLYYKFWRFPIPLGLSYTYSFKDRESQASLFAGFGI